MEIKINQFIKFFLIGGILAITDLLILFLLTEIFGIYYLYSALIGFIITTLIGFVIHKKVTFKCKNKNYIFQYILFVIINIIGLTLYTIILYIGTDILGFYYLYVAFFSKFIVFVWNYLANKNITFKKGGKN